MYVYVLITCIMLVNMLIALMAKTFDNVFEAQEVHCLFLKARTISIWLQYPPVPPPLNLISVPYFIYWVFSRQLPEYLKDRRSNTPSKIEPEYMLPSEWLESRFESKDHDGRSSESGSGPMAPHEALSEDIVSFMAVHGDEVRPSHAIIVCRGCIMTAMVIVVVVVEAVAAISPSPSPSPSPIVVIIVVIIINAVA